MKDDVDMWIRIDTVDQLFNAPPIDPFSDKPAVILGEAALMYAVREQMGRGVPKWRVSRMVIQLPADQITPGLEAEVVAAVRRYAEFKHQANENLIHFSRWQGIIRVVVAITLVLVILLIANYLASSLLSSIPDTVTGLLTDFLTIIIWVILWGPLDTLIFEWLGPGVENYVLRRIMTMEIVLEPEPQRDDGKMSHHRAPDSQEAPKSSRWGS